MGHFFSRHRHTLLQLTPLNTLANGTYCNWLWLQVKSPGQRKLPVISSRFTECSFKSLKCPSTNLNLLTLYTLWRLLFASQTDCITMRAILCSNSNLFAQYFICCSCMLTGPEGDAHAVAKMGREARWHSVTCCKGQPDGHALLAVSRCDSALLLWEY